MQSSIIAKQFHRQTNVIRNKSKRLIMRNSLYDGEYDKELYMNEYKLELNKVFQERIIKPKVFKIPIKKNWSNACDVCLSLGLKDNQYYLDVNMREDIEKEVRDKTYNKTTFNDSIDEVLLQLNKWQVGQYTINVIDAYATLMEFDKNKSVSIPLSIYTTRLEEFDLE
jgi:hypothetical protein